MFKSAIKIFGMMGFIWLALGSASNQEQQQSYSNNGAMPGNYSGEKTLGQQGADLLSGRCDVSGRCNVICNQTPGGYYCR